MLELIGGNTIHADDWTGGIFEDVITWKKSNIKTVIKTKQSNVGKVKIMPLIFIILIPGGDKWPTSH